MESLLKNFTRGDFRRQYWALVKLRYKLIWAHARTSSGKIALLFFLYMLGALLALLFSISGFGVALGMIEKGEGESIARWTLSTLFANGIGLSLLFGLGPRNAFSEESLRRYPLNSQERFAVRHLIGLLDPIWLILVAGAFGLALGFWWMGAGSIFTGIPAAFLFIVANYLATAVLLSIIGMLMQTRTGSALLGAAVILLVSFGPLVISSLIAARNFGILRVFDYILLVIPPGAAAAVLAGDSVLTVIGGAFWLIVWCGSLLLALAKLESRPKITQTAVAGSITWNDFCDQFGHLLGNKYGPLLSKSLRYHLRCNLIRFSLITAPLIVLMGNFLVPGRGQGRFFLISLSMLFIMSSATGAALMLNLFGYDDAGIRRYAVLPISFADALRAGSLASLMLRAVTVFVALALWLMFYARKSVSWKMIVMMLCIALASLFLFNAFGLWTSIFSPKRSNFNAMWNSRLSFGGNVVVIGGVVIPLWTAMAIADLVGTSTFLRFWWMPSLILIFCVGFYAFSLLFIKRPVEKRRERLINLIAGASDN